jgi:hypothetical protein
MKEKIKEEAVEGEEDEEVGGGGGEEEGGGGGGGKEEERKVTQKFEVLLAKLNHPKKKQNKMKFEILRS